jgi:hypothetical protein
VKKYIIKFYLNILQVTITRNIRLWPCSKQILDQESKRVCSEVIFPKKCYILECFTPFEWVFLSMAKDDNIHKYFSPNFNLCQHEVLLLKDDAECSTFPSLIVLTLSGIKLVQLGQLFWNDFSPTILWKNLVFFLELITDKWICSQDLPKSYFQRLEIEHSKPLHHERNNSSHFVQNNIQYSFFLCRN